MANKKIGFLNVTNTISYKGQICKPFRNDGIKTSNATQLYFENLEKRTCTCIIKSHGKVTGIGVAKCHPNDIFDLDKGIVIAEYRAKIDQYERNIKILGKSYGKY